MTTNSRTISRRNKHVAGSARILTTGISAASIFVLTSAYALAAQNAALTVTNEPIVTTPNDGQVVAPLTVGVVVAPTLPAPATVITQTQTATDGQTPVVHAPASTMPITVVVPQPATRSSGSK